MFPVKRCKLGKSAQATTIKLVITLGMLGLLIAVGCNTTVQTEHSSDDESLRSRRVKGPSGEIFEVVARCLRQEFPNGQIYTDPTMGQITVTDYSIARGDAVLEVMASGRPDGMVDVSVSATGLGGDRMRAAIERFLHDFDEAYDEWVRQQVNRPREIE
jgi:hypothetical protein